MTSRRASALPKKVAAALTIAGLDPSGGAGIAADLRAFSAARVWGCAACAVLTVQSTRGLVEARAVAPRLLGAQIEEILSDVAVGAIKLGALGSAANARLVTRILDAHPTVPAIVDPVMRPSRVRKSGARLDGDGALRATRELGRRATLLTPNRAEASALLGERRPIADRDARDAAVALLDVCPRAVLLKGGHGEGDKVVDWLALAGGRVVPIARARLVVPPVHGTGCSLAALIAGRIAAAGVAWPVDDHAIVRAVRWACAALARSLGSPLPVGHGLLVLAVDHDASVFLPREARLRSQTARAKKDA